VPGGVVEPLRRVVLERLIRYYRYLSELSARKSPETITSAQMGEALDIDPTQVRKDFGAIGLIGISRVGYEVCEVCRAIRTVFGFDRPFSAVLVGSGQLGSALVSYHGFARYGLRIVAAFDNDPEKVGTAIDHLTVHSTRSLKRYVRTHEIKMANLTTLEFLPHSAPGAPRCTDSERAHFPWAGRGGLPPESARGQRHASPSNPGRSL